MSSISEYRSLWINKGICTSCGLHPARPNRRKCQECVDNNTVSQRKRRHENRSAERCVACGAPHTKTRFCLSCAEVRNQNARLNSFRLKVKVLSHYSKGSPKCACCNEKVIEFLTIDHINGDGSQHRKTKELMSTCGGNIYRWLRKNHFPPGFRVLCMNCNFAIGAFRKCPHESSARA
jgi:hypothetical protein